MGELHCFINRGDPNHLLTGISEKTWVSIPPGKDAATPLPRMSWFIMALTNRERSCGLAIYFHHLVTALATDRGRLVTGSIKFLMDIGGEEIRDLSTW